MCVICDARCQTGPDSQSVECRAAEDSEEWCVLRTAHDDESIVRPFASHRERSEAFDDQLTVFFAEKLSGSTVKIVRNSTFIFGMTINYFRPPK